VPKSEENIDETYEDNNSKDESDLINENVTKILNDSVEKAIEQFRKVRECGREDITEKEIAEIDKECEIIRNREIITKDIPHKKVEITSKDNQILIGPPMLTSFNYLLVRLYSLKFQKMQQHHLKSQWKN